MIQKSASPVFIQISRQDGTTVAGRLQSVSLSVDADGTSGKVHLGDDYGDYVTSVGLRDIQSITPGKTTPVDEDLNVLFACLNVVGKQVEITLAEGIHPQQLQLSGVQQKDSRG